jgi:hypothetical protein
MYDVKYKKINSLFWGTLKNVKGEFWQSAMIEGHEKIIDVKIRVFTLQNETRLEFPSEQYIFKFSPKRHEEIRQRMSEEAGQEIRIKK